MLHKSLKLKAFTLLTGVSLFCLSLNFSPLAPQVAAAAVVAPVELNETNFPDPVFRDYLKEAFDFNRNNIVDVSEMKFAKKIMPDEDLRPQIKSVKGIELFPELDTLIINDSPIDTIDISRNPQLKALDISDTGVNSLDVTHNPDLKILQFDRTKVNKIDLTHNPNLQQLYCHAAPLTELDLSQNPELQFLDCNGTSISKLDLSHNPKLHSVHCNNTKITALDLSHNPDLVSLFCEYNAISSLDLHANPKLEKLRCHYMNLAELDLSANSNINDYNLYYRQTLPQKMQATLKDGAYTFDLRAAGIDITKIKNLGIIPVNSPHFENDPNEAAVLNNLPQGVTYAKDSGVLTVSEAAAKNLAKVTYLRDVNNPLYTLPMDVSINLEYINPQKKPQPQNPQPQPQDPQQQPEQPQPEQKTKPTAEQNRPLELDPSAQAAGSQTASEPTKVQSRNLPKDKFQVAKTGELASRGSGIVCLISLAALAFAELNKRAN